MAILNSSNESIKYAVNSLKAGNVGIFPTDTVYGIGCDALNPKALKKLYEAKHRNLNNPINILVPNIKVANKFVSSINPIEKQLIKNFWPGPLTIIFKKSSIVPDILNSNLDTIGIRMPQNKVCLDLLYKFGSAIATSSANISKMDPYICINNELINDFKNNTDFIIDDGKITSGIPSTIVEVLEYNSIKILRNGSISVNDIKRALGGNINVR